MKIHVYLLMCMLTVQCTAASDWVFINETTPGFSAAPGDYNATAVIVPLGPYNIIFSTRFANPLFTGHYKKSGYNTPAGKGKDYHMCTYDLGTLVVHNCESDAVNDIVRINGNMAFEIYRYVAPLDYPPTWPKIIPGYPRFDEDSEPCAWEDFEPGESYLPEEIIVNGHIGSIMCDELEQSANRVPCVECMYGYSPDPTTFVVVYFQVLEWAKDVALVIETLNVTS